MMMLLPTPLPAWWGILGVLTALVLLLGTLGAWQRRFSPHPEVVRKLAHMGMGITTLSFPWLFDRPGPVWVICAGSLVLLAAARWWPPLHPAMASVLGRVEREGWGEFYFAFSVALVFWLARNFNFPRGANVLFLVPMLILTLADALGALTGVRYGRVRYVASTGHKSLEGSLAFFIVAFFSTHVPLLLLTSTGRAESLLIGLMLGLLVMLMEAVCGYGTDNLIVPLASFVALRVYLHLGVPALAIRFVALTGLAILMLVWRRRTYMDDSAPLAAALVLYLSGSLGGWRWLLAPGALLGTYTLFCGETWTERVGHARHNVDAVVCVSSAGLLWLFVAWGTRLGETLLFPFTLAFAAHLAMIALAYLRQGNRRPAGPFVIVEAAVIGTGVVLLPYTLFSTTARLMDVWQGVFGLMMVTAATAIFAGWQANLDDCPTDGPRWLRQSAIGAGASLAGLCMVSL